MSIVDEIWKEPEDIEEGRKLSNGTEVSIIEGDTVAIMGEGDFDAVNIPIALWPEFKRLVEELLKKVSKNG